MPIVSGTRLGPYEIVELRGKGGMGDVYRAGDTRLDCDVAVKVLPAELSKDEAYRKRLQRARLPRRSSRWPTVGPPPIAGPHPHPSSWLGLRPHADAPLFEG